MRTEKICVAPGEVGGLHGGDYVVGATKQEIIYFYHIDSCVGVILVPGSKLADEVVVVGAHMGMMWDDKMAYLPAQLAEHAKRLVVEMPRKVTGAVKGKFTHAFFVGDNGDWSQFSTVLCNLLQIPNSQFIDIPTTDAYAFATRNEVQVLIVKWVGRPTKLFGRPPDQVGKRYSSHSLTGKGHI